MYAVPIENATPEQIQQNDLAFIEANLLGTIFGQFQIESDSQIAEHGPKTRCF